MASRLIVFLLLLVCACSKTVTMPGASPVAVEIRDPYVYIVPFETVMVPEEVSANLFNQFVDRLNRAGATIGIEFIILKQGLSAVDEKWLADKNYLRGELFAYVEEVGSTMTSIKARSRIRFYHPGELTPAFVFSYPTENFYQNDYSSLPEERRKLAAEVATNLAEQFLAAIIRSE